jgi:hypothetical protein
LVDFGNKKERKKMKSDFGLTIAPSVNSWQDRFHSLNTFTIQTWLRTAQKHLPTMEGVDREAFENGIRAAAGVLKLRWRNWE